MEGRVPIDGLGLERVAVLERGDRLVLGPVVLEDPPDLLHPPDEREVPEEEPDAHDPLQQRPGDARRHMMAQQTKAEVRADDEDGRKDQERDRHGEAHLPRRQLFLFLH